MVGRPDEAHSVLSFMCKSVDFYVEFSVRNTHVECVPTPWSHAFNTISRTYSYSLSTENVQIFNEFIEVVPTRTQIQQRWNRNLSAWL
jgi:tRNA U38,U39,U40 pseudouridine synthase TruA